MAYSSFSPIQLRRRTGHIDWPCQVELERAQAKNPELKQMLQAQSHALVMGIGKQEDALIPWEPRPRPRMPRPRRRLKLPS